VERFSEKMSGSKSAHWRGFGDEFVLALDSLGRNPLVRAIGRVFGRVRGFRERARRFYFDVVLCVHRCPACGGHLKMIGPSRCACSCGNTFDPTLAFQASPCCGAALVKRTFHYACASCHGVVPSRFLFDEKVFDSGYFREMMRESRKRSRKRKEEIKRLLAQSRSDELVLLEDPCLERAPGLLRDLDDFVKGGSQGDPNCLLGLKTGFNMGDYHDHILRVLGWKSTPFSDITPLIDDRRSDKVFRFITLIFMQNDREVELTQDGTDIWVRKVYSEAYS
jgi:hypothetical protein